LIEFDEILHTRAMKEKKRKRTPWRDDGRV
jgi:hypothetical protein